VSKKFKKYIREVGLVEQFTFHSLRHTFASHLVQKGVSLYIVSKLLGHSDMKTTEIYAHLAPETFLDVVNILNFQKKPEIETRSASILKLQNYG
jgi:site-specific recombinase XerD